MKKAVWVSLVSYASTLLDTNLSPHDIDSIAASKLLEQAGYEVWLVQPYKIAAKQSSYPKALTFDEACDVDWDLVVMWCTPAGADQSLSGPWHTPKVERVCEFFKKHLDHSVYFLADPRSKFHQMLEGRGGKHWFHEVVGQMPVFVPAKGVIKDPGRELLCEYWKMYDNTPVPFNQTPSYGSVYVGMKYQTAARKKLIKLWFDGSTDCYLAGSIDLPGLPSLSNHKEIKLKEAREYARSSCSTLICGELTHTWLTPRVIQGFICGSIASVSSTYPASHWIPDDILTEQTCDRFADFDDALRTENVYQRQVEFVESLKATVAPLPV